MPSTEESNRPVFNLRLQVGQAISMRPDFARYAKVDIRHTIILLARYEIDSMEELRGAKRRNRDCATDDLRRNLAIDYAHYKMLLGLFDSFPPLNRNRGGSGFIDEIPIHQNSTPYKIDPPGLSVFFDPIKIQLTRFQNKYRLLNRALYRFGRTFISILPGSRGHPPNHRTPEGYR